MAAIDTTQHRLRDTTPHPTQGLLPWFHGSLLPSIFQERGDSIERPIDLTVSAPQTPQTDVGVGEIVENRTPLPPCM
jgi:hypothetical protein